MTLFEYLAIAFSLVFSFTAMRLVAGLPHASQTERRYWVHLVFVCGQLLATIGVFWVFWSYRGATWNFPRFLLVLASPGLIYFNACTLVPENASAVESWHDYYYSVRRRYFLGFICWVLAVASASTIVLEMPWSHPARLSQLAFLLVAMVGAKSANERVHSGLALFFVVFALIVMLSLAFRPGSLAP